MRLTCRSLVVLALLWCLVSNGSLVQAAEAKKILLLGQSPDGHPPGTHEYMPGVEVLAKLLKKSPGVELQVVNADNPWNEGPELLNDADGVVLFLSQGAKWTQEEPRRRDAFARLAARGGGLAVIHWGMGTRDAKDIDAFLKLFGGCHGGPDRKYKVVPKASVQIVDKQHPVTTGVDAFTIDEEFYYRLKFVKASPGVKPILKTNIEDHLETVCWIWERPDGGRSFGFSGGHFHQNWRHEPVRRLLAQAVLWTVKQPVPKDGLNVGIRTQDLQLKPLSRPE